MTAWDEVAAAEAAAQLIEALVRRGYAVSQATSWNGPLARAGVSREVITAGMKRYQQSGEPGSRSGT